ncbi:uncharacterized protein [Spinacia oleracea]|uniref:Uncharacterized protein isoform X2 n=1 Tax=Spinacia oleracea TaxID=3562 RepID=A0ABM3R9R4_SPIOL|nr:uncharacterized protein LOC110782530 isoform X2 [Spinacia oleracea]
MEMIKTALYCDVIPQTRAKGVPQFRRRTLTTASASPSSASASPSPSPCSASHPNTTSLSPKELKVKVDIFDDVGIAGGASGVAGGLVHPYSPKVKLLWRGEECWTEFLNLLNVAEAAATAASSPHFPLNTTDFIVRRTGILRPAVSEKILDVMHQNAQNCLASCPIQAVDEVAARELIPNLSTPLNRAFFMPKAVNVNPHHYLKALFLASEHLAKRLSSTGFPGKEIALHKKVVTSLSEVGDEYDIVIVCLGARVDMLADLSGMLPLRTCRGIVAHLQLNDPLCEEYCEDSPSILSDVWLAVQGPKSLYLGSTWEWESRNFSSVVSLEEASSTLQQLLHKTSLVYPKITNWTIMGAQAGVRAMPPLTPQGSFPLLGCIDELVGGNSSSKYWLIGGLGARGLLYHGWLGKLTAQAVLSSNEGVLPPELTFWKKMKNK